jgi:hypothetical protein
MRHRIIEPVSEHGRIQVEYDWRCGAGWSGIRLECSGKPARATEGSLEQFITEHYWGYAKQRNAASLEYEVEHEPWRVWNADTAAFEGDVAELYGPELSKCVNCSPDSAFLADGSSVVVYSGRKLA